MAELQTRQPIDTEALQKLIAKVKKSDADEREALEAHKADHNNPHNVTAEQIGAVDAAYVDAHVLKIAPPEAAGAGEVIFYRGQLLL
jgi:hypothetical protein